MRQIRDKLLIKYWNNKDKTSYFHFFHPFQPPTLSLGKLAECMSVSIMASLQWEVAAGLSWAFHDAGGL